MSRARWAAGLAVAIAMGATLAGPSLLRPQIRLGPGDSIQEVVHAAPAGARLQLARGEYDGPVTMDRALELVAEPGATIAVDDRVDAAVIVAADGVRIAGLSTVGGDTGVRLREVDGVRLENVSVEDARYHGIEIIDASAVVTGARISRMRDDMAQGIEIRNADGRPDSVIESSTVSGGQEGIVSHVSEVIVRDNTVRDTSLRGITITEMSDGVVHDNTIKNAAGAGLYCGDMSRCEFRSNTVERVASTPLSRATEGWGLVVTYHAAASSAGDELAGEAGRMFTSTDGHMRDTTPLEIGAGSAALRPVGTTVAVTLGVLGSVLLAMRPAARMLAARAKRGQNPGRWIVPVAIAGLLVQSFHMIEHWLQVFRVRVDGIPSRGGLVGPQVEVEWVHFVYNGLVMLALVAIVVARDRGWKPAGRAALGDHALLAATAIQGYHFVEHSVKLAQHLAGGAKVNPGIAGQHLDLVLFHFGINLAVYLACVGAGVFYGSALRPRRATAPPPSYAVVRG